MEDNRKNNNDLIIGRNCVSEALRSGRPIDRIFVAKGAASLKPIIARAKDADIVIKEVDTKKLDYLCSGAGVEDIFSISRVKKTSRRLL